MLDTSLQPYSINLFNLLPAVPQETRNLYYDTGATAEKFSRIGAADDPYGAPYIESFEEMMARVRKEPDPSVAGRGVSSGAKSAEQSNGTDYTDYREDNAEKSGRTEKPPVARDHAGSERARIEAEKPNKPKEKKLSDEKIFAEGPEAGMTAVRPDVYPHQTAVEDGADAVITGESETGGIAAADMAAPDAEAAFSPEDGITFTDTYPLFENKPDVRGADFEMPIDPSFEAAPVQDAGVMLANADVLDGEADTVKQDRGAKDGLKGGAAEESGVSEPFQTLPDPLDGGHQFVSFVNNAGKSENGAGTENASTRKKAGSRKLDVEVIDMRSDSGTNVRGGVFAEGGEAKTADMPVKDLLLDLKGAALGSLGDNRQMPAGFDLSNNAAPKGAAQLESFLSRELHNGLNGDIVRQAAVMLRDGGEGLIRLQLHPESLGNVRIKLALSGNRVEGIITVESPEAMNAFERELESLEMAFRDSGFEGASLNMQMSGGKPGGDLFDEVRAGVFSQIIAASSYESSAVIAGEGRETRSIYAHGGLSILA